jgi:DNA-binding transcriptional regulator YiaG
VQASGSEHASNPAECRFPRAEHDAERTTASLRAAEAYRDWANAPPAERPLASARSVTASALFAVLKDHDVSRARFADMLGIDEKTVRQWLDGSKPIPLAAIATMPLDMGTDLSERILDARAGGSRSPKRAVSALREAAARVQVGPSTTDLERRELMKVVLAATARLNEIMREITG